MVSSQPRSVSLPGRVLAPGMRKLRLGMWRGCLSPRLPCLPRRRLFRTFHCRERFGQCLLKQYLLLQSILPTDTFRFFNGSFCASSLNGSCGHTLDDVFLQAYINDNQWNNNQGNRGCHQAVIRTLSAGDFIQQSGNCPVSRETQEEGLGKQVVVAPKEAENTYRGKGGCRALR